MLVTLLLLESEIQIMNMCKDSNGFFCFVPDSQLPKTDSAEAEQLVVVESGMVQYLAEVAEMSGTTINESDTWDDSWQSSDSYYDDDYVS